MTSFERFKRDVRAKSNSDVRSSAFRSSERKDKMIHDLVSFSATEITFMYDENSPTSVFKLQISNLTGFRIHFKIRCNNSSCYTVNPFEEVISDKQTIEVKFQFHPKSNDFSSNYSDKFQIIWGKIPYQPSQPTALTESKIFPVFIHPNTDLFNGFKQMTDQNKLRHTEISPIKTKELEGRVPENGTSFSMESATPQNATLLTKFNLILVCVVSFILGFIFT